MEKMSKLAYEQIQSSNQNINKTTFSLKPLERGFANTLGVPLRRVLLSSITGLGLFAVKIDGVEHEFQTIPGVEEDVVRLILNLQKIKFQYDPNLVSDDDIIKVTLKPDTTAEITSRFLEVKNSNIEIINKTEHIATVNKANALHLEMYLRPGRGFVSAEDNKKILNNNSLMSKVNSDIKRGIFIATDSNFSPIEKVNYEVLQLNTSSLKIEEELKFHLETNGTIEPKLAIQQACEILVAHFKLIGNVDEMKLDIFAEDKEIEVKEEDNDIDISQLQLSVRSTNALRRIGKTKLSEIADMTLEELEQVKNLGKKSIEEIIAMLAENGRQLKKGEE
ncbi:DNA-directed RNA polymerase subunit alpha [Mycoplasmopsis columbina]|uniref:DNA-directed RNA polymerase subunit alpha n=1 Tax=Mycoplasmopsis columbina SF7 TaxID=1037410 RepID=F9UK07_9BACT|nr:DNA-directed RNA polymerase subunit alpha [Mycoplasmopsis columbina]EGV00353.1 DNA-directed RNA polymerase subunit alpha [Mycoplasmopsis columbina SF7]VEU76783.1 DNA-directed RNA polymerase alpha chain [Mycoplasmopsis columbina]